MKVAFLFLVVFVFATSLALAGNDHQPVFINQEGGIYFGPPPEYVSTGLSATPEAMKYPKAIEELLDKDLAFLPVAWKITNSKMVSFQTWQVVKEAELVLVRSENVLYVRLPVTEAERILSREDARKLFGYYALVFFMLLIVGNVMKDRYIENESRMINVLLITLAATFHAALATASNAFTSSFALLFPATATGLAGAAFYGIVFNHRLTNRGYRTLTGCAAIIMAIAVFLALYN